MEPKAASKLYLAARSKAGLFVFLLLKSRYVFVHGGPSPIFLLSLGAGRLPGPHFEPTFPLYHGTCSLVTFFVKVLGAQVQRLLFVYDDFLSGTITSRRLREPFVGYENFLLTTRASCQLRELLVVVLLLLRAPRPAARIVTMMVRHAKKFS